MSSPDWYTDAFPELRMAPPWVMREMIAAQPALVGELLESPLLGSAQAAEAIVAALDHDLPVVVCGCGTSEHAAHAIATLFQASVEPRRAALVQAKPSLSAALEPAPGILLAVSHDGDTRATVLALLAAAAGGAHTIAVTHNDDGGVARAADRVLLTPRHDESWCHTLAYTSALAVGAAVAALLGPFAANPDVARALLERAIDAIGVEAVAGRLADRRVVLCAGGHADRTTARELALKIAEGARLPTVALELESVVHGQLAGHEPADALILVAITDHPEHERVARRAGQVARAAAAIGVPVAALLSDVYDRALPAAVTPAGRIVTGLPGAEQLERRLAGLLAGAGMLQTLTLELAHARHTNPDLIRREQAPYRQAAHEAESFEW